MPPPPYQRRISNDIELSLQLHQLRDLQSHLGLLVQDGGHQYQYQPIHNQHQHHHHQHQEEQWIDEECGLMLNGGSGGSITTSSRRRRSSTITTSTTGSSDEYLPSLSSSNNKCNTISTYNYNPLPSLLAYQRRRMAQPQYYYTSNNPPVVYRTSSSPSSTTTPRTSVSLAQNTTSSSSSAAAAVAAAASSAAAKVECTNKLDDSNRSRSSAVSWDETIRLTNHTDPTVDSSEGGDDCVFIGDCDASGRSGSSKSSTTTTSRGEQQRQGRSSVNLSRSLRSSIRSSKQRRKQYSQQHHASQGKNNNNSSTTTIDTSATADGQPSSTLPNYDFLKKEDDAKQSYGGSIRPATKWWHGVFIFSLISMLASIITLWAPYPIGARMPSATIATMPFSNGCIGLQSCICPRETICADDVLSMIFLTIARSTAWFNYPLYMLLFLSKANNLNDFLQKTALRCWINFSDFHRVHTLFGIVVGLESTCHSFFHLLRWARRKNDIQLLWTTTTGITGLIAITITPLIVLPMTVPYLKKRISFEWRKFLHYLSILWATALMFHAPQRIFWLIGVPLFIYATDKMVEIFFKTHLTESAYFQRLGESSCIISFENPPGFGKQNSAYVYLMLPWLSKYQFHAFTVFPCTRPNHSSVCIHKCGDWTTKLMNTITTPTHKPAFVVGPFLSPFSSPAMDSENLVAVASGIGVTPAISLIKQYSHTCRRLNLIWICRDPGLIEHFLHNVDFGCDGYILIYYTGRERSLVLGDGIPPNIFIFNGRPNLERTISGIIVSIAAGTCLPEHLLESVVLTQTPAKMRSKLLLEKALSIYNMDQLYEYTTKASIFYNETTEPTVGTVQYRGVLSTMRHLLGDDFQLVSDQITTNFERVDTDGDCLLNRIEFEEFFNLMLLGSGSTDEDSVMATVKSGIHQMSTCRDLFDSNNDFAKSDSERWNDEFGLTKHLQGNGKFAAKNWKMLYCGGSRPIKDKLKDFERKFGVGLSVEKFDW